MFHTIVQFYAPYIQICKSIESFTDTGSPIMDFDAFSIFCNQLGNFMSKPYIKLNGDEEDRGSLKNRRKHKS